MPLVAMQAILESLQRPLQPTLPGTERAYQFGPFHFVPARQRLSCGATELRLGGRALDILALLAERAGEVVPKGELMAKVWPRSVVEESNLKVQLSALRRAFARAEQDGGHAATQYVATVNGQGYRFVAPVRRVSPSPAHDVPFALPGLPERLRHLPAPAHAAGRDAAIAGLLDLLAQRRIVALPGPDAAAAGIDENAMALVAALMACLQGPAALLLLGRCDALPDAAAEPERALPAALCAGEIVSILRVSS